MIHLRPYQLQFKADIYTAWALAHSNILARLDTGGGKTATLAEIIHEHNGASVVMAHRQELVGQLSDALARAGVRHNIIAAEKTRRAIAAGHISEFGHTFYDPGARVAVASVDTLTRAKGLDAWAAQVTLVIVDEAHHLVEDNKWHTALARFPHPYRRVLGLTATPARADGKGLGVPPFGDGVFQIMVQGPSMRWLIEEGYLTDYRVVCVESDLAHMTAEVGAGGDWSQAQLKTAAQQSHIVGDLVQQYSRWADGKLDVVFCTDVETAIRTTATYRTAGIRAETLTGETEDGLRRSILHRFAMRQIDVLVTVDIVAEGFDLPALEVVQFGRPTESLALYMQQFGRALRPIYADGYDISTREGRLAAIAAGPKPKALIIDHVNNFLRHGPPDRERPWTLDRRGSRRKQGSDGIPYRTCLNPKCAQPYERFHPVCPYCGHYPEPAGRSSPQQVDGDLTELDGVTLAALRGEVAHTQMTIEEYREYLSQRHVQHVHAMAHVKRHAEKLAVHADLRAAMERWGGYRLAEGLTDQQMQRVFWFTFGIDVLSAQALGREEALALVERIGC